MIAALTKWFYMANIIVTNNVCCKVYNDHIRVCEDFNVS